MGRSKRKGEKTAIESSNKKKRVLLTFISVVVVGVVGLSIYTLSTKKIVDKWENKIYPGITIDNIAVGGMSKEEAKNKLNTDIQSKLEDKAITIKLDDKEFELKYSYIEPKYEIDKAVNDAFNLNKDQSILAKYSSIKKAEVQEIPIAFSYNEDKLIQFEEQLKKEFNSEPKNASITILNGNIVVEKESDGKIIDMKSLDSKVKKALSTNLNETVELELQLAKATITSKDLEKIKGPMGTYSTSYGTSSVGRSTNIEIATKSINGKILMPGETFSFNEVVGDRSLERGFQEAGTYVGNKVEPGIGGGICQVSSTLYRAVMRSNLKSVERTNHSMVVGYIEPGLDATVSYGYLDYKFKNTYNFPIYIQGTTVGKVVTYTIYGDPAALNGKTYDMTNEILEVFPPEVKEVEDDTLQEGERAKDGFSMTGYKVNSYLITYENGAEVNRELIATDNYAKVDSIVKVGTKKTEEILEPPIEGQLIEETMQPPV